jgi:hypothetical protein
MTIKVLGYAAQSSKAPLLRTILSVGIPERMMWLSIFCIAACATQTYTRRATTGGLAVSSGTGA